MLRSGLEALKPSVRADTGVVRVHPELFAEAAALRLELRGPSAARIASILLHRHEIQVSERIVRGQLRRAGLHRAGWPPSRRPTAGMRPPARTSGGSPTCWSARGCPGRAGTSPLPMGCWPSSASAMTRPSPSASRTAGTGTGTTATTPATRPAAGCATTPGQVWLFTPSPPSNGRTTSRSAVPGPPNATRPSPGTGTPRPRSPAGAASAATSTPR